ncbi:MAG: AAA family ATPase [Myxococcales bacterium]|jgi:anion-transporting  ArsA/GET3 family ATPase|nr:AAA family ATPase [Myxococcales bacterium]
MTQKPHESDLLCGPVGQLIQNQRIIVCCGAGGVGKTTTSAALALAGARAKRRVLVLTIDPSKRLAETLGVSQNPPAPVPLSEERLAAARIRPPGHLDAWLLSPQQVADAAVNRLSSSPEERARFLQNRIYQQVSQMLAGMHEYTAMEALHRLLAEGRYDLVILDTPPSRNALDFLEAPGRLASLLDQRIFRALLPKKGGLLSRAASKIAQKGLSAALGEQFAEEFIAFMATFSSIFHFLNQDLKEMRAFLSGPDAAFLLVTSPARASLEEGFYFQSRAQELRLPFKGFILNRSSIRADDAEAEDAARLARLTMTPELESGLKKLDALAQAERAQARRDVEVLQELRRRAGDRGFALSVPDFAHEGSDMELLIASAQALCGAGQTTSQR